MGTKESLYDMNILNKIDSKNLSKKTLESLKLHQKENLYKRDTSRSQHTSQVNTEPNTTTKKKQKKTYNDKRTKNSFKKIIKRKCEGKQKANSEKFNWYIFRK